MLGPNSISACVIAHHEERLIERCIRSLEGVVDEVLVVHDGPCRDATLSIAEGLGCLIFERPFVGASEGHRPFSYATARGEWILNVDADEFLSEELGASLRSLASRTDVNAFEFLWRIWDGERYVTDRGPYKRPMFRKSAASTIGVVHAQEQIDGATERTRLHLEHRPLYNNYALRTVLSKWRRWARLQARQYLSDFSSIPKFNYPAGGDWPLRRRVINRLSPLLVVPVGIATAAVMFARIRSELPPRMSIRLAASLGIYNALVQAYVAKYLYLDRVLGARKR